MRRTLLVCLVLLLALPVSAETRKGGANDLTWATPNQGQVTTWQSGGGKTVTYIDAQFIPFRNANGYVEDLVTGDNLLDLKANSVSGPVKTFSVPLAQPTTSTVFFLFKALRTMTLTSITCITTVGTVTLRLQECDSAGANCTNLGASSLVCATTPVSENPVTGNTVIDADDWVKIVPTAPSSIDFATMTVRYTD